MFKGSYVKGSKEWLWKRTSLNKTMNCYVTITTLNYVKCEFRNGGCVVFIRRNAIYQIGTTWFLLNLDTFNHVPLTLTCKQHTKSYYHRYIPFNNWTFLHDMFMRFNNFWLHDIISPAPKIPLSHNNKKVKDLKLLFVYYNYWPMHLIANEVSQLLRNLMSYTKIINELWWVY